MLYYRDGFKEVDLLKMLTKEEWLQAAQEDWEETMSKLMGKDWYESMAELEFDLSGNALDSSEELQWSWFYLLISEAYEDL